MRCEVTMSRSHTFDTLRNIYVHRHHPRLSLVGELRAACLDGHSSLQGDTSGAPWSVGCVAEHGARSSLDLKGDLVADRLTLYTCVSEYRTCVSSHRVERHASVPSAEPKKRKKKQKVSSSSYRRRFREALTSRHRLRASLLEPRPQRIHRIRRLSQSRLHQLAHERIF